MKGIALDCRGDDRTKCQQDVAQFVKDTSTEVQDVDTFGNSSGSHGPACVAGIKQLGALTKCQPAQGKPAQGDIGSLVGAPVKSH